MTIFNKKWGVLCLFALSFMRMTPSAFSDTGKPSPDFMDRYFSECGTYEAVGRLECKKAKCQFYIFERSQDQMILNLTGDYKLIAKHYNGKRIKARFNLSKVKSYPLTANFTKEEMPVRVLPNEIEHIEFLKSQKCQEIKE